MYDVQLFIDLHSDHENYNPELIRGAIRRLLEIWHTQDTSPGSFMDRGLRDEAEKLVEELESYDYSADEIEIIDEWSDDFRAFLRTASIKQSAKETVT